MTKIIQDTNDGEICSAYTANADFAESTSALRKNGYSLCSLEELARLRMLEGSKARISIKGSWTSAASIFVPRKGHYLTWDSPINKDIKNAVIANADGKHYHLNSKQLKLALAKSVKITSRKISTLKFAESPETDYLFGLQSKKFGFFLREHGIKEMPIYFDESEDGEDQPYATQIWFCGMGNGNRSYLYGHRALDDPNIETRGVKTVDKRRPSGLLRRLTHNRFR